MSVVEDRLSGFLLWPSFYEGILIPQWGDHSPLLAPYLRQAPLLGLAFPLLRSWMYFGEYHSCPLGYLEGWFFGRYHRVAISHQ